MTRAQLDKSPADVAAMFDPVAERYDLLNDVLSLGQDRRWRSVVARLVAARGGDLVLDIAAGTGTSSRAFTTAGARCGACDFSLGMPEVGAPRRHTGCDASVIGAGSRLDNLVQIAHNVRLGRNVVIASQTGISGSSVIEDGVLVGGQVGIADHVRVEEGAILGAQCGIPSKKVVRGKGIVFWGTPARPIAEYLRELATLARLTKKKK